MQLCLGLFVPATFLPMSQGLALRFWLDEYAFTSGETTLLREEIEVSQACSFMQQEFETVNQHAQLQMTRAGSRPRVGIDNRRHCALALFCERL